MRIVCAGMLMLACLTSALAQAEEPKKASVLVVYYSEKGHTQALAEAVAKGAKTVDGVEVLLRSVKEAKVDEVLAADAVIVGTPVYKANVAPVVQEFINSWPIKDERLRDKIGAAFATGSGISGGEELAQMDILHAMLVCGMIVVGGRDSRQPFGASAITGENPSDKPEKDADGVLVKPYYLQKGEVLGKRVAELAARIKTAVPKDAKSEAKP